MKDKREKRTEGVQDCDAGEEIETEALELVSGGDCSNDPERKRIKLEEGKQ